MKKKRHSPEEIITKLHQAGGLANQGKTQAEIAKTLGVSVMTYHRWRKEQSSVLPSPFEPNKQYASDVLKKQERDDRINELELENRRLRRLVTDLLLEKMKLEEAITEPKRSVR